MINQVKLLVAILAGWISRQQQQAIDYLMAENKVLKEKLGKKRILLNDDQRRRLACGYLYEASGLVKNSVVGKSIGISRMMEVMWTSF